MVLWSCEPSESAAFEFLTLRSSEALKLLDSEAVTLYITEAMKLLGCEAVGLRSVGKGEKKTGRVFVCVVRCSPRSVACLPVGKRTINMTRGWRLHELWLGDKNVPGCLLAEASASVAEEESPVLSNAADIIKEALEQGTRGQVGILFPGVNPRT